MASEAPPNMLNQEVAYNLVTITAILEYLEQKDPGAKEEIHQIGRRILEEHDLRTAARDVE